MVCQVVCISFVYMPQGLALLLFECRVSGIGNAKGSGIGFISMPKDPARISFVSYLITRLRATVQLDCMVMCNMQWGGTQRSFVDGWIACNRALHLVSGVLLRWN